MENGSYNCNIIVIDDDNDDDDKVLPVTSHDGTEGADRR
jgi:hypothetical protein